MIHETGMGAEVTGGKNPTAPAAERLAAEPFWLVPRIIRGAAAERPLKIDPPPLLRRGLVGAGLGQTLETCVEVLGTGLESLITASGIILGLVRLLRRLHACLPALRIGTSGKQQKGRGERGGKGDA